MEEKKRFAGPGAFLMGEEEWAEVREVLETGHLSRYGHDDDPRFRKKVQTFERDFADRIGVRHGLAINSGTSALISAMKGAGIGPGDEVLVPGYTFVASLSSIVAVGARPVLVEVDESLTMDPSDLEGKCTSRTRAVVPVHMLGNPCDMDRITGFARERELILIEDVAQALGASYRDRPLGSFGDAAGFSLNNYKVLNTGDGGIMVSDDDALYNRAFAYHDQGHKPLRQGTEVGEREVIGMNLRMNELSGAVALAQLRKLDTILASLRKAKERLKAILESAALPGVSFRRINDPGECHTLLVLIFDDPEAAGAVAKALGTKTIDHSGWHVYNNMEQMLDATVDGRPIFRKHELPKTDELLPRCVNFSIGVVDSGIGADRGITILSSPEEIDEFGEEAVNKIRAVIGGR